MIDADALDSIRPRARNDRLSVGSKGVVRSAPVDSAKPRVVLILDVKPFLVQNRSNRSQHSPSEKKQATMREIVHIQGGQCGNQIGAKFWEVRLFSFLHYQRAHS